MQPRRFQHTASTRRSHLISVSSGLRSTCLGIWGVPRQPSLQEARELGAVLMRQCLKKYPVINVWALLDTSCSVVLHAGVVPCFASLTVTGLTGS